MSEFPRLLSGLPIWAMNLCLVEVILGNLDRHKLESNELRHRLNASFVPTSLPFDEPARF
jgi:hypothetical protein